MEQSKKTCSRVTRFSHGSSLAPNITHQRKGPGLEPEGWRAEHGLPDVSNLNENNTGGTPQAVSKQDGEGTNVHDIPLFMPRLAFTAWPMLLTGAL